MSADVSSYLNLVTSEFRGQPNFTGVLTSTVQPLADATAVAQSLPGVFDLDVAAGVQLDVIGQWVGRTRYLETPLTGVYFSWGTDGVGWGQGVWQGPFDPSSGLTVLPDPQYRTLLRAVIAANHWDGTIPGAYTALSIVFTPLGESVFIQDHDDMSMTWALLAPTTPDAVTLALFETGELALKPVGVRIDYFVTQTVPGAPYFGWGIENASISGWGVGAWGNLTPGA